VIQDFSDLSATCTWLFANSSFYRERLFDESNLPTRRQLRSDTSKQRSPIRKVSPDVRLVDASQKAAKVQRDGSRSRKSRTTTPSSRSDAGQGTRLVDHGTATNATEGIPMQRSSSKGSQTDLPAEASTVLDDIVEETFKNAERQQEPDASIPDRDLEAEMVRTEVESRSNSPGVDPRSAIPPTAEDAAQLLEPLVEGLGSHDGHHKAATAHLPPKEVQERHLRLAEKAREHKEDQAGQLSIDLPPRDGGRAAEPLSSPGSTIGAHSATTPALHDASTDTSPDNESSRYDAERLEQKDEDVQTPPELRKSPEEIREKEEHDRILKAQMKASRDAILGSSPTAADTQLRMEEQAASFTEKALHQSEMEELQAGDDADASEDQDNSDRLTKEADEVVQDVVEDEDEVVGVPTPEDDAMTGVEESSTEPKEPAKPTEVADSEGEDQTPPVETMDVDRTTVKDSFESSSALESRPGTSPVVPAATESVTKPVNDSNKSSATPTSTPRRTPSTPAAAPPTLERMTTRVASGAMRHKSVSEILGEIPRPNTTSISERSAVKGATDSDSAGTSHSPSRSTTPQSPGTRMRSLVEKAKEKERSKLSTVVFAKQPSKQSSNDTALMLRGAQPAHASQEDYFTPLFLATASTERRGVPSLDSLLQTAHKTITTSNAYIPINENQTIKVLKRIYNLQSSNKWSMRQPKRSPEPVRPNTQWDVLLQEAKWMRTDFREERKWKMTVARNLVFACAEWVESSPEDRKLLQVKAGPPKYIAPEAEVSKDAEIRDSSSQDITHPTPDLVASGEFDSPMDEFDDEPRLNLGETVAPTAIFALQDDDVVFGLRRSPTTDKLLNELPMYSCPLKVPQTDVSAADLDPDRFWRREALPLSKWVEGRMELKCEGPPRKKSRFQYEQEDDDEDQVVFGQVGLPRPVLAPETTDVALFNPEHKHIRDRIHAGHQFRPPSEYPMPLQSFFECRTASQWTWAEDDELKGLVREYSYNWSLISSMLTSRSLFSSGAERRTPWECFERWIHLEGLPADMQKTHYFRAYTSRVEAANRNVMAQVTQAPQLPGPNNQIQPPPRRRTTTSVRVERRRNQKHLTLVDAMRKLAKKRETSLQKQQHAAGLAAMRKSNEQPQPRTAIHTPQDFSRLRQERDEQFRERMQQMQQRQEAQRRVYYHLFMIIYCNYIFTNLY
jgi:chromatin modification-related protein VID21